MSDNDSMVMVEDKKEHRGPSTGRREEIKYTLHLLKRNPLVLAGSFIAIGSIILAVFSGLIAPSNLWERPDYGIRLCWNNPVINWPVVNLNSNCGSQMYILGTDNAGRDLFKMIILSLPTDLEFSFLIVLSAVLIGVTLGSIAAYTGSVIDEIILRVTDIFFAFPGLVLAIVLVTVLGHTLINLTLAVLIVWWPLYVRLTRSQILAEKEKLYVEALRCCGVGTFRILFKHIIPNTIYPVLVQATLDIGGVILTFSALMFLGFSPSPLFPELGNLVSSGIDQAFIAPWLIIFPGITILVVALGFNLLGDGIRDILDPRLRR